MRRGVYKIIYRNQMLEIMSKTLNRKIHLFEPEKYIPGDFPGISSVPTQTSSTDQLILGVRDQVTRFVLNKVAKQTDNLEAIDKLGANFPTRSHRDSEYSDATERGNYAPVLSQPAVPEYSTLRMDQPESQSINNLYPPTQTAVPDSREPGLPGFVTPSSRTIQPACTVHYIVGDKEGINKPDMNMGSQWPFRELMTTDLSRPSMPASSSQYNQAHKVIRLY